MDVTLRDLGQVPLASSGCCLAVQILRPKLCNIGAEEPFHVVGCRAKPVFALFVSDEGPLLCEQVTLTA